MAWKQLTIDDLRMSLAEEEIEKLDTLSLDPEKVSKIVQETLDMVSDAFRGAFQAKGYDCDVRPHYTPPEYTVFILAYARWVLWCRMPMAEDYALSEPRKLLLEESQSLLKNPFIGTSKPSYEDDPELSA